MDEIISLTNQKGMSIICSSVGAGLIDIAVPDRNGNIESVLVRPRKYSQYFRASGHFGKPCGRTAGRIFPKEVDLGDEKFTIETTYPEKTFALHGGKEGISEKCFDFVKKEDRGSQSIIFTYLSKDGEGGYPGNLTITITYTLYNDENRLFIHHEATTDKKTLCNLTCHAYFNLSGNASRKVTDETLYLNSSRCGVVDENTVATSIMKVDEAFDFRTPHKIGDHIEEPEVQKTTLGYDHPYLLDGNMPGATLYDQISGRFLEIDTNYESCVLYSCNHPAEFLIQNNKELDKYDAICIEMQHFPNTVNSSFIHDKKDVLTPNYKYDEFIEYKFSTK